jgi:uncharacterized protein YxjI
MFQHGHLWQAKAACEQEKQYDITFGGRPIIHVDQKWLQIRDSYKVDVIDGVDAALAAALVWSIDQLLEH